MIYYLITLIVLFLFNGCTDSTLLNTVQNRLITIHKKHSQISPLTNNESIVFAEYNGKVYSISSIKKNNIKISIVDSINIVEANLKIEEDIEIQYKNVKALAVTKEYVLLFLDIPKADSITQRYPSYVYYFENSKNYPFIKKVKSENESIQGMYANDSIVYFTRSYFYHPADANYPSLVETRKIQNLELINSKVLDIKGIEFSHFSPYRNIDVLNSKGYVLYSDFNSPVIRLLDKELNLIDSISYLPKFWNVTSNETLKRISDSCAKINPIDRIKYLGEKMKNGLSKISNIGFINDSTFFVAYFSGNEEDFTNHTSHFDFFRISNNKIVLYKNGLTDISNENYTPMLLSENIPIFKNNKAYFFTYYDYNSLNSFSKLSDWISYSLSLLTGSKIDMNLVIMEYYDL